MIDQTMARVDCLRHRRTQWRTVTDHKLVREDRCLVRNESLVNFLCWVQVCV